MGKSSLVRRFVHQMFSDKYHTTIGVKVDKKEIELAGAATKLMIWDLEGEEEFESVHLKYTRGADGCLLVVDGTRKHTLATVLQVRERLREQNGDLPCVCLFNKADLTSDWVLTPDDLASLPEDLVWFKTSAKEDTNVDVAFHRLAQLTLG